MEVSSAPTHTDRHLTSASGRNLKRAANNNVTTPSDTTISSTLNTILNSSEIYVETQVAMAASAAESTRDTNSRKPTTRISPKEKTLSLISLRNFPFGFGLTS